MVISPIDALALTYRITPERESIISLKAQVGGRITDTASGHFMRALYWTEPVVG